MLQTKMVVGLLFVAQEWITKKVLDSKTKETLIKLQATVI